MTFKVTLEFDNKEAAENFQASWLDGGLDGGGNLDWNSSKWTKKFNYMRIKGTGCSIEWIDGEMVIMTPDVEEAYMKKQMEKYDL